MYILRVYTVCLQCREASRTSNEHVESVSVRQSVSFHALISVLNEVCVCGENTRLVSNSAELLAPSIVPHYCFHQGLLRYIHTSVYIYIYI